MNQGDWSLQANGDTYMDCDRESTVLINRLRNSMSSTTAVAGPRGAGKSSLALRVLQECKEKDQAFSQLIHCPTGYSPHEFLVSVFQRTVEEVIARIDANIAAARTKSAKNQKYDAGMKSVLEEGSSRERRRLRLLRLGLICGALFVLLGAAAYTYYQEHLKWEHDITVYSGLSLDISIKMEEIPPKFQSEGPSPPAPLSGEDERLDESQVERALEVVRDGPQSLLSIIATVEARIGQLDSRLSRRLSRYVITGQAISTLAEARNNLSLHKQRLEELRERVTELPISGEVVESARNDEVNGYWTWSALEIDSESTHVEENIGAIKSIVESIGQRLLERSEWIKDARDWVVRVWPLALLGCGLTALLIVSIGRIQRLIRHSSSHSREPELRRIALRIAERLRYQTSQTMSVGLGVSVANLGGRRKMETRPLSLPGVASEFVTFLDHITDAYKKAVICLDELDKIGNTDDLEDLMRGIKPILGRRNTHFILTVSEDALARFTTHRRIGRGMLESSFEGGNTAGTRESEARRLHR